MRLAPLLSTLLLALPAAAQSAPCLATNDQNTTVSNLIYSSSSAGPNRNAWQITPTSPITVQAVQIFTGNAYIAPTRSFQSIEVWDDNGQGAPGTRLASGTWRIQGPVDWHGANLDAIVVMQANTPYWIAFVDPGWSTVPVEPGGTTMPSARQSGGTWTVGGSGALKARLFCGLLDGQGRVPFGGLCAGAAGNIGTLATPLPPSVGNTAFRFEGSGFSPSTLMFLAMGFQPQFPTFQIPGTAGCYQSTDAAVTVVGFSGAGDVRSSSPYGHVQFDLPLPTSPAFVGLYFSAQLAGLDAGSTAAVPFTTSNAMQVTLF